MSYEAYNKSYKSYSEFEELSKFELESFFNEVKHIDTLKENNQYCIQIRDNILLSVDYSKLHLITNNNTIVLSITFKNKETYVFRINLNFVINLAFYNFELNENLMKITLFMNDTSALSKTNYFNKFLKLLNVKSFLNKASKLSNQRMIIQSSYRLYKNRLKRKGLTGLSTFYFISIRNKINFVKFKKIRQKICWLEFIKNYINLTKEKIKGVMLKSKMPIMFYFKFITTLLAYKKEAKTGLCSYFQNRNIIIRKIKSKRIFINLFQKLKLNTRIAKITKHQNNIADAYISFVRKRKYFGLLKNNLIRTLKTSELITQNYKNKLKLRFLIALKSMTKQKLNLKNATKNYNFSNFEFFDLFYDIKTVNQKTKDKLRRNTYYLTLVRQAYNMIKNNYLKNVFLNHSFINIVANYYNNHKNDKVCYYFKLIKNKAFFKKRNKYKAGIEFFRKAHETVRAKREIQNMQISSLHNLLYFNYHSFVKRCFILSETRTSRLNAEHRLYNKRLKFSFFQFLNSLYLVKKRKKENPFTKSYIEYKSARTLFIKNNEVFYKFSKELNRKTYLLRLLIYCKLKRIERAKLLKFQRKNKAYEDFFKRVKREVIFKSKTFKSKKNKPKLFFKITKEKLNDTKLSNEHINSYKDNLVKKSFKAFKINHYLRKQKSAKANTFTHEFKTILKAFYLNDVLIKTFKLRQKVKLVSENHLHFNKLYAVGVLKKAGIFNRLKRFWVNNLITKHLVIMLKTKYFNFTNQKKSNKFKQKHYKAFFDNFKPKNKNNVKVFNKSQKKLKTQQKIVMLKNSLTSIKSTISKNKYIKEKKDNFKISTFFLFLKNMIIQKRLIAKAIKITRTKLFFTRVKLNFKKKISKQANLTKLELLARKYLIKHYYINGRVLIHKTKFIKIITKVFNDNARVHFNELRERITLAYKIISVNGTVKNKAIVGFFNKLSKIYRFKCEFLIPIRTMILKHSLKRFMLNIIPLIGNRNTKLKAKKAIFQNFLAKLKLSKQERLIKSNLIKTKQTIVKNFFSNILNKIRDKLINNKVILFKDSVLFRKCQIQHAFMILEEKLRQKKTVNGLGFRRRNYLKRKCMESLKLNLLKKNVYKKIQNKYKKYLLNSFIKLIKATAIKTHSLKRKVMVILKTFYSTAKDLKKYLNEAKTYNY
jgi:hypothetical protein